MPSIQFYRYSLQLLISVIGLPLALAAPSGAADSPIAPLLEKYCARCHGEAEQEGNLRVDQLDHDISHGDDADRWHELLNRLNVGEMPPEDEPQPTAQELESLTQWITKQLDLAAHRRRASGGQVVLRRLNRREYGNTLRDLVGMPLRFEKPLPPDGLSPEGYTNNGTVLAMSPLHFDYYLKIAREVIETAIPTGSAPVCNSYGLDLTLGNPATVDKKGKKKPATLKLVASYLDSQSSGDTGGRPPVSVSFGRRADRGAADQRGAILAPGLRARGTGIPGRQVPNPSVVFRFREFPTEGPVCVRVIAGATDVEHAIKPQVRVFIGTLLDDGTEFAFLGPGQLVTHGPDDLGVYEFHGRMEDLPLPFRQRVDTNRGDLNVMMVGVTNSVDAEVDQKKTPQLLVSRVEFEAPFYQQWPPRASQEIFFDPSDRQGDEVRYARQIFERFMTRAWRRPVTTDELNRIHSAWKQVWEQDVLQPQTEPEPTEEPEPSKPGIQVSYYDSTPPDASNESLDAMSATATGVVEQISLDVPVRNKTEKYGLRFTGTLDVPRDGTWTLRLTSDDGSRLYLDRELLIDNDGNHGMKEVTASVSLSAGAHQIAVNYFNSGGGYGLQLQWEGPGIGRGPIAPEFLSHGGTFPEPGPPVPTFESTIKEFLPAILASPNFLYLAEPAAKEKYLTDYELASRLSYLLWSTLPDDQLLTLAHEDRLRNENVLRGQTRRMLQDHRSSEFIRSFVDGWLDLDGVWRVAISKDRYKDFWDETKQAMQQETRSFFAELLQHDLSALNLLRSDFTLLNDHLAEHYRIAGVYGPEFRRVALSEEDHRGGVLTHGSTLYGGSDGRDSHPIRRGVWLLKRLLDDPPPDPPPNVPDLDQTDPKLSGLPLIKQLELHREHRACANCHRKIDPWGLAFEGFDAVGRFRGEDRKRKSTSGAEELVLPDGTPIHSIEELKSYLVEHRQSDFARALTKNLLTYALGRSLDFSDQPFVESLTQGFQENNFRIRWLLEEIVVSEAFRSR